MNLLLVTSFYISVTIYFYAAYVLMTSLVGSFWSLVWFFIPVGMMTLPFWAYLLYGFSSTGFWVSYFTPFFLYALTGILNVDSILPVLKRSKTVELSSGISVDLAAELPLAGRLRRLLGFGIDYALLYFTLNIFNLDWMYSFDEELFTITEIEITGGRLNSLLLLIIFWVFYFCIIPIIFKGCTIGKLICRIRLYTIEVNTIEIARANKILQREGLRLLAISVSTYGSFFIPGNVSIVGGIIRDSALFILFFAVPYLLIFKKEKLTLFDMLCNTIVADKTIKLESAASIDDYEEFYNNQIIDTVDLSPEEE